MTSSALSEYARDVGARNEMTLAVQNILVSPTECSPEAGSEEPGHRLNIAVVFTSVESTLAALKEAGVLAISLAARLTLFVPQVVPYVLPLESPPVLVEWNQNRFRVIAGKNRVNTIIQIY
jgi:hypothetical protein